MGNIFDSTLENLRSAHNLRSIPKPIQGDSALIDLSSNDYLGIAADSALQSEFLERYSGLPLSASASRLLATCQGEFQKFESLLADFYGGKALIFNSGYHANSGAIAAIGRCGRCLIVADKLVHASIIDGIILSRCQFERFRHNDVESLERILKKRAAEFDNVLIVVESVYSMDGDSAPLEAIARVKSRYANSMLYVDEAHALGVCGSDGLGLASGIAEVDFIVGTLGKAIGSVGAFILCRNPKAYDYLVNTARSLIFSTALPPINVAWSRFVMERLPQMENRRTRLKGLSRKLAQALGRDIHSHIQPLITGSSESALSLSAKLLAEGFKVLPIRTPTVPKGTERLRFSLSADIKPEDIDRLGEVMNRI